MSLTGQQIGAKLKAKAKNSGQDTEELAKRFACERLLARLVQAGFGEKLVLVGNHLFWASEVMRQWARPTIDIDVHDYGMDKVTRPTADAVLESLKPVMAADLDDGVILEPFKSRESEHAGENGGCRVWFSFETGGIENSSYVDVSFGGVIPPTSRVIEYSSALPKDFPPINVLAMPLEHAVGEKVCAMIQHGKDNSRLKDFYDLLVLKRHAGLDTSRLIPALAHESDEHRKPLPIDGMLVGLTNEFALANQDAWQKTLMSYGIVNRAPANFQEVVKEISDWLAPCIRTAATRSIDRPDEGSPDKESEEPRVSRPF